MYNSDERLLIELLNQRFDDVKSQMSSMKQDLLREAQSLSQTFSEHEKKDESRYQEVTGRLTEHDKIVWKASGIILAVTVIGKIILYVLEHTS
jgi:hypothetical protein